MIAQYLQNAYLRAGSIELVAENTHGKAAIDSFNFGFIVVAGKYFVCDVLIHPDGTVREREPGKGRLGSHTITKNDIIKIAQERPEVIVIGNGTSGMARLSADAESYARQTNLNLLVLPSFQAVEKFNHLIAERKLAAALIHVTC